jgi:3-oxoadipate enol-lactonase
VPVVILEGLEFYYEVHGVGDPLVVIGGLGLGVSELQPLVSALAQRHRVTAVDNRGSGKSSTPPGP